MSGFVCFVRFVAKTPDKTGDTRHETRDTRPNKPLRPLRLCGSKRPNLAIMPEPSNTNENLKLALRRVVLLRETGPKSAAWHRARVQTIWRLHQLLEQKPEVKSQQSEAEGEE
jgi:hypothetical protein